MQTISKGQEILTSLESLWQKFDTLFAGIEGKQWQRRHGRDWTFADVPYHLAYFDREMVADAIRRGPDVPAHEQVVRRTMAELNEWNAERFRARPAGQTPRQSLEQMQNSRQLVRQAVAGLKEGDLERPAWLPLPTGGWITAGAALESGYLHTWGHFIELRARLGLRQPELSPAQNRRALEIMTGLLAAMADTSALAGNEFKAVMNFTGQGEGAWTVHIVNGVCSVREGHDPAADLVVSQSAETLSLMRARLVNPLLAMLTGRIKVRGLRKMGTFGKVFSEPPLDRPLAFKAALH